MIKAVIFDCFGVLVGRGFEETYRIAGGDPIKDRQFINDVMGQANLGMIGDEEFHQAMMEKLGITLAEWRHATITAEQPNAELLEYIQRLHGKYKTAILSNANKGVIERRIGSRWLTEDFDELIVSAEIGIVKPDPEIYKHAAEKLGVEPMECVFVDDKAVFLEPAEALGMKTVLYENFDQARADLETILANTED
jgi:epoxide hydrolase-like predicted phosphatase